VAQKSRYQNLENNHVSEILKSTGNRSRRFSWLFAVFENLT